MSSVASIQAGNAAVSLTVKPNLTPGLDQAEKELKHFAGSMGSALGNLGANLKQQHKMSEEEGFNDRYFKPEKFVSGLADMIGGAGTGLGLVITSMITEKLASATDKARELVDQFREGKITEGEMYEQLVKQIPILGDIWAMGRNIREMATGEKAELKFINDQAELTTKIFEGQVEAARRLRGVLEEIENHITNTKIEMDSIGGGKFSQAMREYLTASNNIEAARKKNGESRGDQAYKDLQQEVDSARKRAELLREHYTATHKGFSPEDTAEADQLAAMAKVGGGAPDPEAEEVLNAEKKYRQLLEKQNKAKSQAIAKTNAEAQVDQNKAIKELANSAREEWNDFAKNVSDAVHSAYKEVISATEEEIRHYAELRGKQRDEELLKAGGIENPYEREKAEIKSRYDYEVDVAQKSGEDTTQILRNRFQEESNLRQRHNRELQDYQLEQERDERLAKAQGVENPYEREKQEIAARYDYEVYQAQKAGNDIAAILRRRHQEELNALQRHNDQVKDANDSIGDDITRAHINGSLHGLARDRAMMEVDRNRSLARELDPRTTSGVGVGKINQLFDQLEKNLHGNQKSFGTFSGSAARISAGGAAERAAKATEETAKYTKKVYDILKPGPMGMGL